MSEYKVLLEAVKVKGDSIFSTKSELIGILAFKLGILSVGEAKDLVNKAISEGIIEETEEGLKVNVELIEEEEESKDIFGEMVEYIARQLGMSEIEVLEEIEKMKDRYGNLDKKVLAYLYGMEKGLDMEKFREDLGE
ncbi:DUF2240 family protein [Pyrococcus abyssi]|uniref:DUF2240 family protein n=1 Tax=Pyrococcus abyssi (strain GE5 / Orsay) TaxID=272844 RepID=Q9UZR5_PYRAB|nr:UPF0175 family protein [Pyrococcus abyssi]CAB49991.1 Hypothetical protein PAB0720 [Pyrococcus abyssi GE5]CCE70491.1 TPA: hypothetical protein PAB0720 [Pyrococcus abyssi GE5]